MEPQSNGQQLDPASEPPTSPHSASSIQPISAQERIETLDLVRGVAVLGILVMNIQSFSSPTAAYSNPTVWGDLQGVNLLVWLTGHLFFDVKFISMFSLLFGAGILLMMQRAESKDVASPARVHLRRMGWLLLFGLAHAYLLWYGDILVTYAICGSIFFLFRKRSSRALMLVSGLLLGFQIMLWAFFGFTMPFWPDDARAGLLEAWTPSSDLLQEELDAYRGDWLMQMPTRAGSAMFLQVGGLLMFTLWRVGGMMLLGMALLKAGFLSGGWSVRHYALVALTLGPIGLALTGWGAWKQFQSGWSLEYSMFLGSQWNYLGSIPLVVAYIALLMLSWKLQWFPSLCARLRAVGRMAFTNYILQTVLCTSIYYGHGLGMFGRTERWQQAVVIVVVWTGLLAFSSWWLGRFRQGPLEAAWRWGTYGKLDGSRRT